MNTKALLLTVAAILLISRYKLLLATHFDDNQRSGYFFSTPGSALLGHVLSTHYVQSSLVCGHLCLANEICLSFNFGNIPKGKKFLCELSSSDAKRSSMNLQPHCEYDYFAFLQNTCPQGIAVLPYIDDRCHVDTSLIILSKGEGNVTDITHATFNPRYVFNFSEAMRVCQILGGSMASFDQMQVAWEAGFQKCRYGWLADGRLVVPMHKNRARAKCLNYSVGLNPSGRNIKKSRGADAYCVGVRV